jgi:uncharacterized protein
MRRLRTHAAPRSADSTAHARRCAQPLEPIVPPLIRIPANDIPNDGLPLEVELTSGWLNHHLRDAQVLAVVGERRDVGRLKGRLSRSGHDIVVRTRITAAVQTACARCLEPAHVAVDADLSLLLQPQKRGSGRGRRRARGDGEYVFSPREAELDTYDGEAVVLDAFVREAILLEIPNFPLCSETCEGIPTPTGSSPAAVEPPKVDPRIAPLHAFRKKMHGADTTIDDLVDAAAARAKALGRPILRTTTRKHGSKGKKKKR